ncbi:MAG: purU [Nevskia sp.]|nr:purU [Nevskia sp.]
MNSNTLARLVITCADRPGIVAAVTSFLFAHDANITELDQHSSDAGGGRFFMRIEFQTERLDVAPEILEREFGAVVGLRFAMDWHLHFAARRLRMAVLVSRHDHAALELLWRWQRGELPVDIPCVISNHPDLQAAVGAFGIPFVHVPFSAETQAAAEQDILQRVADVDFIVLARYMRVLSAGFVAAFPNRIINIHHSFLPAFAGGDPYGQAQTRGVKIIGATAHYVTAELDHGPIIEQDVVRVTHRHELDDLKGLGRDLERQVLARAVRWHVEDRVLVDGNKTVVFA